MACDVGCDVVSATRFPSPSIWEGSMGRRRGKSAFFAVLLLMYLSCLLCCSVCGADGCIFTNLQTYLSLLCQLIDKVFLVSKVEHRYKKLILISLLC